MSIFDLLIELTNRYSPKAGDYTSTRNELDKWRSWHLSKGTYLLLKEKLEVVCWRNLARRTYVYSLSYGVVEVFFKLNYAQIICDNFRLAAATLRTSDIIS